MYNFYPENITLRLWEKVKYSYIHVRYYTLNLHNMDPKYNVFYKMRRKYKLQSKLVATLRLSIIFLIKLNIQQKSP